MTYKGYGSLMLDFIESTPSYMTYRLNVSQREIVSYSGVPVHTTSPFCTRQGGNLIIKGQRVGKWFPITHRIYQYDVASLSLL